MLKNYLIVTFRNFLKYKGFTIINVAGLAIGIAACLLILHYVNFEKGFDKFHENSDRIYRLRYERSDEAGQAARFASCCPPAAARIRGKYPAVEKIGRILSSQGIISYEDKKFREERLFYAEPDVLEILKFEFIKGDPIESLSQPNNALISQSIAKKYFGDADPIGKTISYNQRTEYQVMGVFKDVPNNSHWKFDILLPWENLAAIAGPDYTEAWGHTGSYTYLITKPGVNPQAFESKLLELVEAECPWLKDYKMTIDLKMQPLTDIHLTSHFMQEYEVNGDLDSVNFLFLIAFFIIVMAWVNYVNLSTACSLNRAKEVGLRKVVGASRKQLMIQFFFEVTMLNFISIICAVGVVEIIMPAFCQFTGIPIDFGFNTQGWFWLTIGTLFIGGIVLSGIYPVLAMSSFKPMSALKNKYGISTNRISLRKVLVVFQFFIATILIISSFTVFEQLTFMRSQNLGFNMDQTLVVKAPRVRDENYGTKFESFKNTLVQNADIRKISHVTEVPGRQIYWDAGAIFKAGEDVDQSKNYQIVGVDYEFAGLFELKFVAGRNFSENFTTDTNALILNETAVGWLGFADNESAIGQEVNYWGNIHPVIGVLKDYHQQSLKEEFEPHIFRFMPYGRGPMGMIAIKLNIENISETKSMIKNHYDELFPGNPFDYFFLDEYYDQQYKADDLFGNVFSIFTLLAITITALGIFGLSLFSASQRTKEIGIRKVMGASVSRIIGMLTKEFIILVLIANLIAWPTAYYAMKKWLEGFANRVDFSIAILIYTGLLTLLIALFTVSYQAIKAAGTNPVNTIQHE